MDALVETRDAGGPAPKLAGFILEGKRSARPGMRIVQGGGIRHHHHGCPSPTLGVCIAMGFLDVGLSAIGTPVEIDTGKGVLGAKVAPLPSKAPKSGSAGLWVWRKRAA